MADLGDRKMWVNLADRSVSYPCLLNDYEPLETAVIKVLLQPGITFVDIGANIGWFSALASTYLAQEGAIFSFEPRPETYGKLSETMRLTAMGARAQTFNVGLSDQAGTMNLTWGRQTSNPGGSRLVHGVIPDGQDGALVDLRTLDSFELPGCDLIKIDVEEPSWWH